MKTGQKDFILMGHGSGGMLSRKLIDSVFFSRFNNMPQTMPTDSAILRSRSGYYSFTTDSFVVKPLFFPGGDIGKLAVCGTVNDLSVSGANAFALSAAFIIEEGFSLSNLEKIADSMAEAAREAGVSIVTGDTKVVEKGFCDGLFITTSGIGCLCKERKHLSTGENIKPGDVVIVNGTIGDHGMAIMASRKDHPLKSSISSDCAPLNSLVEEVLSVSGEVRFMRDATRGGLGAVLCELVEKRLFGIEVWESRIPVRKDVCGMCDLLGIDPVFTANEGKIVIVVGKKDSQKVLSCLRKNRYGKCSEIIGEITDKNAGFVNMITGIGGSRILSLPAGDQLPRIC